jgi:hypothetical protein
MRDWRIILLLMLICGCAVGPDYQRPGYPVPPDFRGEGPGIHETTEAFGTQRFEVLGLLPRS